MIYSVLTRLWLFACLTLTLGLDLLHTTGMNLLDLRKKVWAPEILAHAAPGLAAKLGDVCASHTIVGKIAPYFHKRYGFAEVRPFIEIHVC